jgi:hypothetical protein
LGETGGAAFISNKRAYDLVLCKYQEKFIPVQTDCAVRGFRFTEQAGTRDLRKEPFWNFEETFMRKFSN